MTKIAWIVVASAGALMLAGCGSSQKAGEGITADSVEIPAEEAVTDVDAMPVAGDDQAAAPAAAGTDTPAATDQTADTPVSEGAASPAAPAASPATDTAAE